MSLPIVLVTGSKGQLGNELQVLAPDYPQFSFHFTDVQEMPIDNEEKVLAVFEEWKPGYVINCAAYTAVDKAESDIETCRRINAAAAGYLAKAAKQYGAKLIHISTDYVFDGTKDTAYTETDGPNPQSVYGATKLEGEQLVMEHDVDAVVIRTSWVYSSFGNNFVKTMMRLMGERDSLNVVGDQVGSPTYAKDLAAAILAIAAKEQAGSGDWFPGIYHFSNEAEISWFDFATTIKEMIGSNCTVGAIPTTAYPTPAKRPMYSLMDKGKFVSTFGIPLQDWKESLRACIQLLQAK